METGINIIETIAVCQSVIVKTCFIVVFDDIHYLICSATYLDYSHLYRWILAI